jgi:predicted SAM-dependent methyltransferase
MIQQGLNNKNSFAAVVPQPSKIIVGAGNTFQNGFFSLQHKHLDVRNRQQWQRVFRPNSLDTVLSEHVLEHLDLREAEGAARNIWEFLRCGGRWRIAVPDGFHTNANYLNWVSPDSRGERFLAMFREKDEPNHKRLWNYQTLSNFLAHHGFMIALLEWFDANGQFHRRSWNEADGKIHRRAGSGWSNFLSVITDAPYTSLIVDAKKICK